MFSRFLIVFILFSFAKISLAQYGGSYSYAFTRISPSARLTALGEFNVTTSDHDPSFQLANPAAMNPSMHRHLTISQSIFPGGINSGNFAYAHDFKRFGTYGFGVQYVAFGNIPTTDESGNVTGSMNLGEVSIYGGGAYRFGKLFSVGLNLKLMTSHLAQYTSVGMATDIAASVHDPKEIVLFTIAVRNLGGQFNSYTGAKREMIPLNLQAGLSFGFKELPLRFHLNLHDLTNWNLRYDNPADAANTNLFEDTTAKKKSYVGDEIFRHVVIGVELNIKKIVYVDFAYNHQRRVEYKQETRRGLAGFSFGFGVRVKAISAHLGLSALPLKQTMGQLTLNINTAGFTKKKKVESAAIPSDN